MFFAHVGWLLTRKHPDVLIKGKGVPLDDLYQDPVVMFNRR
jgi:stearoyl-CoA desaturase (delta-9 desaturase)